MNFDAVRWAKAQTVSGSSKGVLVALAMHVDKEGCCYPAVSTLADLTGKSERTVQRALRDLEKEGFVVSRLRDRSNGSYTSSEYYLFMGQNCDMPEKYMQALADFWDGGGGDMVTPPGDMVTPPGDMVTPPGDMVTPLEVPVNTNKNTNSNFFSSPSLFLGEFEKTTEWLTRVFRKPLLEKLLRERPQRQILWLALPREKISQAIQLAQAEAQGSFLTNLKDYLDLYADVDALQKKDFPAAPKKQAEPDKTYTPEDLEGRWQDYLRLEQKLEEDVFAMSAYDFKQLLEHDLPLELSDFVRAKRKRFYENAKVDEEKPLTDYAAMSDDAFAKHLRKFKGALRDGILSLREEQLANKRRRELLEQARASPGATKVQ